MSILYQNDFVAANGSAVTVPTPTVGVNNLIQQYGTTLILLNRAYNNTIGSDAQEYNTNETLPNDYDAEVTAFVVSTNTSHTINARWTDDNNCYSVGWVAGAWYFYKMVAGVFTQFQTVSISYIAGDTVVAKISCIGTTIRGFVNGVEIFTPVTDSSLATGQQVSIQCSAQGGFPPGPLQGFHVSKLLLTTGTSSSTFKSKAVVKNHPKKKLVTHHNQTSTIQRAALIPTTPTSNVDQDDLWFYRNRRRYR